MPRSQGAHLLVVLGCGLALVALLGPLPAAHAQDACSTGPWSLSGAAAVRGESTAFVPAWETPLEEMASCMQERAEQGSCLVLRGHFDVSMDDSPEAKAVFANDPHARKVEAKALAAVVMARLYGLGVPMANIHIAPSNIERTFRGVEVAFAEQCPPAPETVTVVEDADIEMTHEGDDVGGITVIAGSKRKVGAAVVLEQLGDISQAGGQWDFVSHTGVGLSLQPRYLYIDVLAALALSPDNAQGIGFSTRVNVGYRELFDNLLRVGIAAGYHQASFRTFDPWLVRAWWIGVHSAQCFSLDEHPLTSEQNLFALCAQETFAPGGQRVNRARAQGNQLLIQPKETERRLGFDVGVRVEMRL